MGSKRKKGKQQRGRPPVKAARTKVSHPAPPAKGPLLSIGMIFRNDIRCIEKCLAALAPLRAAIPCQLVMADTGSTDGSRAVAERYADILIDFPWINDFSAARNAVMDRCSGVWYLTVDTDEYLDPDIGRFVAFLTGPEREQYDKAHVTQRNYSSREMLPGDYSDFAAPRMLRMATGYRYVDAIHEGFPTYPNEPTIMLTHLVLHHDGYTGGDSDKKKKRNFPLLEAQVAKDPQDVRSVMLCLESCYTREQSRKYAAMAVELVKNRCRGWETFGDSALMDAVAAAKTYAFPELEEWAALAWSLFPHRAKVTVDIEYYRALRCFETGDYAGVLERAASYREGLCRVEEGEYESFSNRGIAPLRTVSLRGRLQMALFECVACCELGRWEEALSRLGEIPMEKLPDPDAIQYYMRALLLLWQRSVLDVAPLLKREYQALWENRETSALGAERWQKFQEICRKSFTEPEGGILLRPACGLFAALGGGCDLGRAGLSLETSDTAAIGQFLAAIEGWDYIPVQALEHAMTLGAAFPESFYRRKTEVMERQAKELMELNQEKPDKMLTLLWNQQNGNGGPGQIAWQYNLAMTAISHMDWKGKEAQTLCNLFRKHTAEYLELFYNPKILTEETLYLLPASLRFGWHYLRGHEAWESGNPVEYINQLRKAVRTAPEMKEMVKFLTKRAEELDKPQEEVSAELLALAEKVRTILSAYPADDPAIAAIKASPVYQKVAYLIEEK